MLAYVWPYVGLMFAYGDPMLPYLEAMLTYVDPMVT